MVVTSGLVILVQPWQLSLILFFLKIAWLRVAGLVIWPFWINPVFW